MSPLGAKTEIAVASMHVGSQGKSGQRQGAARLPPMTQRRIQNLVHLGLAIAAFENMLRTGYFGLPCRAETVASPVCRLFVS